MCNYLQNCNNLFVRQVINKPSEIAFLPVTMMSHSVQSVFHIHIDYLITWKIDNIKGWVEFLPKHILDLNLNHCVSVLLRGSSIVVACTLHSVSQWDWELGAAALKLHKIGSESQAPPSQQQQNVPLLSSSGVQQQVLLVHRTILYEALEPRIREWNERTTGDSNNRL